MVDYILNARHMSPDGTARGYYTHHAAVVRATRGARLENFDESLDHPSGDPVQARVYQGQWIADCECNGASFVDPEFPVFFCFSCGNRANDGRVRPVEFPADWREVEAALLERPVDDIRGLTDAERAGLAQPLIHVMGKGGLARNWLPGESVDDLHKQQDKPIKEWLKAMRKV